MRNIAFITSLLPFCWQVADQLNKTGPGSCDYIVADVSVRLPCLANTERLLNYIQSQAGCQKLVDAVKAKEDKIHILVNNSGVTWGAPYDK